MKIFSNHFCIFNTILFSVFVSISANAGNGKLTLTKEMVTSEKQINLTTEGTLDWALWTAPEDGSMDAIKEQKDPIVDYINGLTLVGNPPKGFEGYSGNDWYRFSWSNGVMEQTVSENTSGVYVTGKDNGMSFTVPADNTERIIKIYADAWNSKAKLVAVLSDGSATEVINNELEGTENVGHAIFKVTYMAGSLGQKLTVYYTVEVDKLAQGGGNVSISAVSLSKPETGNVFGVNELKDKIRGGWVGQMAGCAWGGPTEFWYNNVLIKESEVPAWSPADINKVFSGLGDDLYCEIPFLDAMTEFGPNCDWNEMGKAFNDSKFDLWHANYNGRENLRKGLKVPMSGHYLNNKSKWTGIGWTEQDDIDFQIEADFAGIVAPALPNVASDIAWRAGHSMNWGNGVYGGVMVAVMHSAAYNARSIAEIVEAGRLSIPEGSRFRQMMDDLIGWHREGKSFEENWRLVTDKTKRTTIAGKGDPKDDLKASDCDFIDVTQNGAYIVLGLLYGNGDFEKSMKLAMQSGCDSDCNPSSVGAILGTYLGFTAIPSKWKSGLNYNKYFPYTTYTVDDCIDLSYELAKEVIKMSGNTILNEGTDAEEYIIAPQTVIPVVFEQCGFNQNSFGLTDTRLAIQNTAPVLQASGSLLGAGLVNFTSDATDSDGIKEYCWFFGDLSYEKSRNPTHKYAANGDYQVVCYVSDKKGYTSYKEMTVKVDDATLAEIQPEIEDNFSIYPNPNIGSADAKISFNSKSSANVSISIYTLNGSLVKTFNEKSNIGENQMSLNFRNSPLQAGVYLVRFGVDGESKMQKYSVIK